MHIFSLKKKKIDVHLLVSLVRVNSHGQIMLAYRYSKHLLNVHHLEDI